MNAPTIPAIRFREGLWLWVGSALVTAFVFSVPPTPFDALDFRSIFLPYQAFYRSSVLAGQFPFWNPFSSLGRPFAADPQAIVFWPPNLVYLLTDIYLGAALLTWAHIALACWGSAKLCLRLGADRFPALASGLVFAASGKLTGHFQAGHIQFVLSYLYLPALLYATMRVQDERSGRSVAFLALLSGVQFLAGAPQVYWNCALACAFFAVGQRGSRPWGASLRALAGEALRIVGAYVLGLALSGVLLVPLWELVGQSNRSGPRGDFSAYGSLGANQWLSLFSLRVGTPFVVDWEMLLYPGEMVAIAGLAGLLVLGRKRLAGLVAVFIGSGFIASSGNTVFYKILLHGLPGYASFHIHGRTGSVIVYALVAAAAVFVSGGGNDRRRVAAVLGVGAAAALLFALVSPPSLLATPQPGLGLWWHSFFALASGCLILAAWLSCPSGKLRWALGGLAAYILVDDLFLADLTLKRTFLTGQSYSVEAPLAAALGEKGLMAPDRAPPRVFAPPTDVRGNAGMLYGFGTIVGSEALALKRVWFYLHWAVGVTPPELSDIYYWEGFMAKGAFPVPWVGQVAGVSRERHAIEVHLPEPSRVWVSGRVREVADWSEGVGRLALGHDPTKVTLVESAYARELPIERGDDPGTAAIAGFSRNSLSIDVDCRRASLLVVDEAWFPGWTAWVGAKSYPVIPVNGWMRGVALPAGHSRVEMRYYPSHFGLGLWISGLTALCLFLLSLHRPRPGL